MPPYEKEQGSDAIDDGWTICDGDGHVIAHVDTETMADKLIEALDPPERYAAVTWSPADLDDLVECKRWSKKRKAEFLARNAERIREQMVSAGYVAIDSCLSYEKAEKRAMASKRQEDT